MARAYILAKGSDSQRDGMIWMVIEGPTHLIDFATKSLKKGHERMGLREPLETEGEVREYFNIKRTRKHVFMADWKAVKADYAEHIKSPQNQPPRTGAQADVIKDAAEELAKAEAALQRALSRLKGPERHARSSKYLFKALSDKRGGVRRAHRQLVVNTREADELNAIFSDKDCKHPRPLVIDRVPYRDPFGRPVTREACLAAAKEHWGMCIKAHRLDTTFGPVTPEYAAKIISTFGCLEIYLSFMRVGDTNAVRLPVIEKALSQLKTMAARINERALKAAYEVACEAVQEFTAWMEMVNAMYHHDVNSIVQSVIEHQRYSEKSYEQAVALLRAMRSRLVRAEPEPVKKKIKDAPFTISVCAPEDSQYTSEECA